MVADEVGGKSGMGEPDSRWLTQYGMVGEVGG